jgi:NitT/TauT family transport system substrate-binding protein
MLSALSRALLFRVALASTAAQAQQLDKVTFATNWVAEASTAASIRRWSTALIGRAVLTSTILPGGPNANHRLQLLAGKIEFYMSANSLQAFDAAAQNVPTVAIASMFQKDPQVLLVHPGPGLSRSSTI